MMPPKKLIAARNALNATEKNDENGEKEEEKNGTDEEEEEEEEVVTSSDVEEKMEEKKTPAKAKKPAKNIFSDEEVLEGKRKRTVAPSELKLTAWLTENFMAKDGGEVKIRQAHSQYLETCMTCMTPAIDEYGFARLMKKLFAKGCELKEDSQYKGVIKAKKPRAPKTDVQVQAETMRLKMRTIIEAALRDLTNPKKGASFHVLKKMIAVKYPALRIDIRPDVLKTALARGVAAGYVDCLRGIGKCGFYRLTVEDESDEETDDEKKDVKDKKDDKDKADDGDEEAAKEDGTDEDKEDAKEGDAADEDGKDAQKKKSIKKRKRKPTVRRRERRVVHGRPKRVEDCFPLAFTYMVEPKKASIRKIRSYIEKHYRVAHLDSSLRTVLGSGEEKGYWESHNSGYSGHVELTVDNYNPNDDGDMAGKVMNGIMACTEPKRCSAALFKRYVLEYHPELGTGDKPARLRKALQRAVDRGDIRQLSGIGATGTFELSTPFTPSPAILAGDGGSVDGETDEEDDDTEEDVADGKPGREGKLQTVEMYRDSYKPRPSSRRGFGRACAGVSILEGEEIASSSPAKTTARKRKASAPPPPALKKAKTAKTTASGKRKIAKAATAKKAAKKSAAKKSPRKMMREATPERDETPPRTSESKKSSPSKKRAATPKGRSATPKGRSATPKGRSATPKGGSATPKGRSATPKRGSMAKKMMKKGTRRSTRI